MRESRESRDHHEAVSPRSGGQTGPLIFKMMDAIVCECECNEDADDDYDASPTNGIASRHCFGEVYRSYRTHERERETLHPCDVLRNKSRIPDSNEERRRQLQQQCVGDEESLKISVHRYDNELRQIKKKPGCKMVVAVVPDLSSH